MNVEEHLKANNNEAYTLREIANELDLAMNEAVTQLRRLEMALKVKSMSQGEIVYYKWSDEQ